MPEGTATIRSSSSNSAERPGGDHFGAFWQVTPDLLCTLDLQGRFIAANPAWKTSLGWSARDLRAASFLEFVHPDDRAETVSVWNGVRSDQPALRFENRYRMKNGGWRWLSWVAVLEADRVYGSARDVDAEKQQAAALARTIAERDRIMRNSRDLITVIDLRGSLLSVNAATYQVLGWRPEELIGRKVTDFIHPDDQPPLTADGRLIAERYRHPRVFVNRFLCKDGSHRWMSWSSMTDDGLVYSQGRDVTAEREQAAALQAAEASLRQSQKMEAVGQLTGGIAHDFNNLLAAITGSLEIARRRIAGGRWDEIDRHASAALCAARRASALTHRLLAFSRRQALDPRPVDVDPLLTGLEDLIRRTVGPSITLERSSAPGLWTTSLDANQLENAILNLCINARDAMPGGGRIRLETANQAIDDRSAQALGLAPGDYIVIRVSDTGSGMSAEVAAKAFEPFFTTKPLGRGTGLGLSMVYGFVRQSGGQVRITSVPASGPGAGREPAEAGSAARPAPACGTTLHLYLPRHAAPAGAAETEATVRSERRRTGAISRKTVLVIDDEPTLRMLIVEVLTDAGFSVLSAEDGVGGLQILQSPTRIDLLVTDVGLPGGLNGRQVAQAARLRRPNLQVLFITGYADDAGLAGPAAGDSPQEAGTAILAKPFAMDAFEAKLRAMLFTSPSVPARPSHTDRPPEPASAP